MLLDRDLNVESIKKTLLSSVIDYFLHPKNLMCCTEWINFDKLSLLGTTLNIHKNVYKQEALMDLMLKFCQVWHNISIIKSYYFSITCCLVEPS